MIGKRGRFERLSNWPRRNPRPDPGFGPPGTDTGERRVPLFSHGPALRRLPRSGPTCPASGSVPTGSSPAGDGLAEIANPVGFAPAFRWTSMHLVMFSSCFSSRRVSPCVALAVVLAASLAGCGARSAVDLGPDLDGGARPDAQLPDGSQPDGGGLLQVTCPAGADTYTSPHHSLTLTASATSPDGVASQGWRIQSSPSGSTATNAPTSGATTMITTDVAGDYQLDYSVTDGAGRTAGCSVTVHSVVGPPVAICPAGQTTAMGVPVTVVGEGYDDVGVASFGWTILHAPRGSAPTIDTMTGPTVVFTASQPGSYTLQLTVTDVDGATDQCTVVVRVTAPPIVTCPMAPIEVPTRHTATVTATATDDRRVVSTQWELLSEPMTSMATPSPITGTTTMITPDRQGTYVLRFTATDDDGLSASCEATVIGLPSPPTVMCPARVDTHPLTTADIMGSAVDDGTIVSYQWTLVDTPMGSGATPPMPPDSPTTSFTPDIAGIYHVQLTATDNDGMTGSCTTEVRAINTDGLRVEIIWNTDATDMDTHLLDPTAMHWFNNQDDCYYANCVVDRATLEWGAPGPDDNPRLDIDDTDGFGPENINITSPQPGVYRVGVHAYRGNASVTVSLYCGGSTTSPRQIFGPVPLLSRQFWRVADVTINATGGCTISDLASSTGPNVTADTDAMSRR